MRLPCEPCLSVYPSISYFNAITVLLICLLLVVTIGFGMLIAPPNLFEPAGRAINDDEFLSRDVSRVYIYSGRDDKLVLSYLLR
jgi:hypothetical protein